MLNGVDLTAAPFGLDERGAMWVENTLASLTLDQKVGQMFCLVAVPATREEMDANAAIGEPAGYMRRPAPTEEILDLNAYIQERATVPMLIAANTEAGASGLAVDATGFGSAMQVAATDDPEHAYRMGVVAGAQSRARGANWSFAPIIDIQFNWASAITNIRGFGSYPDTVSSMGAAFVRGVQEHGVAASIKHWPGDGVDDRDQHLVTSINLLSVDDWIASYGKAYQASIDAGALTVMSAHIAAPELSRWLVPGIRDEDILPASLAPELTTVLLRDRLGFNGLVVSDASTMAGMQIPMPRRAMVPASINAGCDMFLFSTDYEEDFGFMRDAVLEGLIPAERVDQAVTRVLALKAALGLHLDHAPRATADTVAAVDSLKHNQWAAEAAGRAITLVKNKEEGLLPLSPGATRRVLVYSLRGPLAEVSTAERMCAMLRDEGFEVTLFDDEHAVIGAAVIGRDGAVIGAELLAKHDLVLYLADVWPASNEPTVRLAWTPRTAANVPKYLTEIPTVFVSLGSPFHLQDVPRVRTFINAYGRTEATMRAVVDRLVGRQEFTGVSPVDPFCGYWDARL
jgi:beta-N-acetylhexosaminidase